MRDAINYPGSTSRINYSQIQTEEKHKRTPASQIVHNLAHTFRSEIKISTFILESITVDSGIDYLD